MRSLLLVTTLAAALVLPGCLVMAAAAGAAVAYGYVRYDENEAFRDYRADVDATWAATKTTLARMGYAVPPEARFQDSRGELNVADVHVHVTANSSVSSRVAVTVGTFSSDDHRERATAVLDGIALSLGE